MNENTNADVNAEDTEGQRMVGYDEAPAAIDDDDTEGHRISIADDAPSISGALNTGPKTLS